MNYSMVTSGKSPERVESWLRCEPIIARTATIHQPMAPAAYDCVKLVVVRDGSALLLSEFGQRFVTVGDRSEERRVGKECRSRRVTDTIKEKEREYRQL